MPERGSLPAKYREFRSQGTVNLASIRDEGLRDDYRRLLAANSAHINRNNMEGRITRWHWGMETENHQPSMSSTEDFSLRFSTTEDPIQYYRRVAKRYKGTLKRIVRLQKRVDESKDGVVMIKWKDIDGHPQETRIDQQYIYTLHQIAYRTRNTLFDAGYQSVVSAIEEKINICLRVANETHPSETQITKPSNQQFRLLQLIYQVRIDESRRN